MTMAASVVSTKVYHENKANVSVTKSTSCILYCPTHVPFHDTLSTRQSQSIRKRSPKRRVFGIVSVQCLNPFFARWSLTTKSAPSQMELAWPSKRSSGTYDHVILHCCSRTRQGITLANLNRRPTSWIHHTTIANALTFIVAKQDQSRPFGLDDPT